MAKSLADSKGKMTISKTKKELDVWFSRYIRLRDDYTCFTCGKKLTPQFSQCGHFVIRKYNGTRWEERNCACQCYACNINLSGNSSVFAQKLIDMYGPSIIKELNDQRNKITKLKADFYNEKIAYYKARVKEMDTRGLYS